MFRRQALHRFLSVLVLASLLSSTLAPIAHAQDASPGQVFLPVVAGGQGVDPVIDLPSSNALFRTRVAVSQSSRWRDLDALGVTLLERGDDWATLLVDDEQLATLARRGFQPRASDEFSALVAGNAGERAWLAASLQPMLAQMAALQSDLSAADASQQSAARAELRDLVQAMTFEVRAAVADLDGLDADGDGLTNTEESWWCTDALNADTDGDGTSDGAEVAALKDWLGNRRTGPPSTGRPFAGWPPATFDPTTPPTCRDGDADGVPDMAERWDLGLNMNEESTDRDKFDDGQELFGTTEWGRGALPRVQDDAGYIFAEIPTWVKAPGNHPFVAAFPVPEIDVVASSLKVETVTTITTDHVISSGTEKSYSTAKTEGTSTSVADMVTWNEWQEHSIATTVPLYTPSYLYATSITPSSVQDDNWNKAKLVLAVSMGVVAGVGAVACIVVTVGGCALVAGAAVAGYAAGTGISIAYGDMVVDRREALQASQEKQQLQDDLKKIMQTLETCNTPTPNLSGSSLYLESDLSCKQNVGQIMSSNAVSSQPSSHASQERAMGNRNQTGVNSENRAFTEKQYQLQYPVQKPTQTTTNSAGNSWGGAKTTTTEQYEEHTITNGEAFSSSEAWGTAIALDTAHTADLWFSYKVRNMGTEYARQIGNLAFNLYIGDDPNPAYTYFVAPDLGGSGLFQNFMPNEEHTYTSRRIPLSLEQMKAIDLGGPIRVVVEDFTYGNDEGFFAHASNGGVTVALEDGTDDGDERIDSYLLSTWGEESVVDVLARYFPHTADENGTVIAIWTPEYRADTPAWCAEPKVVGSGGQRTLWCKHALSTADWWNVYTNGLGDGSEGLQDTPASPGAVALFRFNSDTDLDGYSDRSEDRLGTDPNDASDFPRPELLAGLHSIRSGTYVTATLSLLNTGLYDAYGVEAVMIAPDDSVSIINNTVGGSGRVRAQKQVIVGSRIALQTPLPAAWLQANHAQPSPSGYYTGNRDRVYTFTVQCGNPGGCDVGSGVWGLAWNDGAGASASLNFSDGYKSPTQLAVGAFGLTLGMLSGKVYNGESFTVDARTPRDTFQYTINREPYTAPLVIVSYNDPQGNHRFILPPAAASLTTPSDNLAAFSGQMLDDVGVEIVTLEAYTGGPTSTSLLVNNPSETTLIDAHIFLEFINISGTVVSEVSTQATLPPGPTTAAVAWDSAAFDPAYRTDEDYIVMAFLTDYQGNILDTAGRPLSSFQDDPRPEAALDNGAQVWDFGTAQQGTLLEHPFALASVGYMDLLTHMGSAPGLSVDGPAATSISPGDVALYTVQLNTESLPVGAYEATIPVRTSDPQNPAASLTVRGTITAMPADAPGGAVIRPLDVDAAIAGDHTAGEWVTFSHSLGPDAQSLHPVKVYSQDYGNLYGVGKYATDFGAGTASYDMFGDGRDGVMPGSGNLDNNNGFASGSVNGTAGATSIAVTDRYAIARVNPGDVVLIHQTRGSGAGQWELNKAVADFTGSGTFALEKPLKYNYVSNGGNEKAQILRVPQYSSCNVTGTVTPLSGWNGDWGGILAVMCNGDMNVTGALSANGGNGVVLTYFGGAPGNGGSGGGYRGGASHSDGNAGDGGAAFTGEGTPGLSGNAPYMNGQGGGGGQLNNIGANGNASGGGGGHASSGGNGMRTNSANGGQGGSPAGDEVLSRIFFGGGGGGGYKDTSSNSGGGGGGGGIILVMARSLLVTTTGSAISNGGVGGNGNDEADGGGGAGGTVLIWSGSSTINANRVAALGGVSNGYGGAGSSGRIRVEYCDFFAGSTNPPASTQKLNCHIAEQVETAPYDTTRLNLPESFTGGRAYKVQYGRRLQFTSAGAQTTTIRLPKQLYSDATLDALVNNTGVASGPLVLSLDFGNNGTTEWSHNATTTFPATLNVTGTVAGLNAYLVSRNDVTWGADVDVPVRVVSERTADLLLTNLVLRLQVNQPTVSAANVETAADRPLDWPLYVAGNYSQGAQYDYTHTLGPDAASLHPCLVYDQSGNTLKGVGKYCSEYGDGTASYEMFGDGRDGVMPDSGNLDNTNGFAAGSVNGSAGATSISVTDRYAIARVNPGDVVLIHQTRGSGAGQWELNKATADFTGSGTFALEKPLKYAYVSNGGNERAQILRVPQYSTCNVIGTVTPLAPWNGDWGGIFAVKCASTLTVEGVVSTDGWGHYGGSMVNPPAPNCDQTTTYGHQGEGSAQGGDARTWVANGNGGGGGRECNWNGGGGGGHASPGTPGTGNFAQGGGTIGSSILADSIFFGGGGGSGAAGGGGMEVGGYGGRGGGMVVIGARDLVVSGSITARGAPGQTGSKVFGGGGGGGGAILVQAGNASLSTSRLIVDGGLGGPQNRPGGNGGIGRIQVDYCTSFSGTTSPSAYTRKLNCYAAEQLATAPYTTTRIYLPDAVSGDKSYLVQYGRRFVFGSSGQQTSSLRLNRRVYGSASLHLLVSNASTASGNLAICLDLGNDGVCDYSRNASTNFPATLEAAVLAEALNNYLLSRNDIAWGDPLDVPVRLTLDRQADVMLTNLTLTPLGAKTRFVRLQARTYTTATLGLEFRQPGVASGPLAFTVDVGADGTVDWSYAGTPSFPARPTSPNLAAALNAYLSGGSGEVDVPIRITPSPFLDLSLTDFDASPVDRPDLIPLSLVGEAGGGSIVEGDVTSVTAVIQNNGPANSGPLAVTFFATLPLPGGGQGGGFYIGTDFVPNVPRMGTEAASIQWNTLGFSGDVTVRAVVDPFNRTPESDESNNSAAANLTILTRPELSIPAITLSDDEPQAGETVTVTLPLRNSGQTASGGQAVALFNGSPESGVVLGSQSGVVVSQQSTQTISFAWTPPSAGVYRLFGQADRDNAVDESDETNNRTWRDLYVGQPSPLALDSGAAGEQVYSTAAGYGVVDEGLPDVLSTCSGGPPAETTLRRDPGGRVLYRFDHLLPAASTGSGQGHFYHLDVVMHECDSAGRQQTVFVDGNALSTLQDLGDGQVHRLSLLLDPALYADRSIVVSIEAQGVDGAVVNQVTLHDVDYRYADAGSASGRDPQYGGGQDYGWLDGAESRVWGSLPYQSVRVDQNDAELRYRFDHLKQGQSYQVHATFWQGSGGARVQKLQVDGGDVGSPLTLEASARKDMTITVPPSAYQGDGSIVVSVVRLNAATGALVSALALEELTQAASTTCHAQETPFFSEAYGDVTVLGAPAPLGAIVQAINPRGETVGCFTVTREGKYGFMRIYGEDATANPPIAGMRDGELVSFKVDGAAAVVTPSFAWHDDRAQHRTDLNAGAISGQLIAVKPGWNFASFWPEPTNPLVSQVLQSIAGRYDRIFTDGAFYNPAIPPQFNTLRELHTGIGYYLRLTPGASTNLLVEGVRMPVDTLLPLAAGWNMIGYLPGTPLPVATALQSIAGKYTKLLSLDKTYDPAFPDFSTLVNMEPGQGYLIYMSEAATLVYPTSVSAAVVEVEPNAQADGCQVAPTPALTLVYGAARIDGAPAPLGTRIEALDSADRVVGCMVVRIAGKYGFMHVYGAGSTGDVGLQEGESIHWRIDGQAAQASAELAWQNDRDAHSLDLELTLSTPPLPDAGSTPTYLPLIQR